MIVVFRGADGESQTGPQPLFPGLDHEGLEKRTRECYEVGVPGASSAPDHDLILSRQRANQRRRNQATHRGVEVRLYAMAAFLMPEACVG